MFYCPLRTQGRLQSLQTTASHNNNTSALPRAEAGAECGHPGTRRRGAAGGVPSRGPGWGPGWGPGATAPFCKVWRGWWPGRGRCGLGSPGVREAASTQPRQPRFTLAKTGLTQMRRVGRERGVGGFGELRGLVGSRNINICFSSALNYWREEAVRAVCRLVLVLPPETLLNEKFPSRGNLGL